MKRILLIEFSESLLRIRTEILQERHYEVVPVTADDSRAIRVNESGGVSAIVLGHGTSWEERRELINQLRHSFPSVPVLALLRRTDVELPGCAAAVRADDPVQWILTVDRIVGRVN